MPLRTRSNTDDPAHVPNVRIRYKTSNEKLEKGDHVFVRYTEDGTEHERSAVIIDTREIETEEGVKENQYYVHYEEWDRRLDEWIDSSKVIDRPNEYYNTPRIAKPCRVRGHQPITRSVRRIQEEFSHKQKSYEDMDATTAKLEKQHEERTKVKNVQKAVIGRWEIDVWYYSPYPRDTVPDNTEILYICEYCLFYFTEFEKYKHHVREGCKRQQPPGHVVYRQGDLAVYEVFGNVYKLYCQSLCLLSKLFLDHKTLYYEVENFRFYVLCEMDTNGAHIVGHFSKEYGTSNNLACIMVLPPYQRRGYGKLLIQLSYALSRRESRIGTPEKPLSDLGKVSYRSYWWWILLRVLDEGEVDRNIAVTELSEMSGIHPDDIVSTLSAVQMVKYYKMTKENMIICSKNIVNYCKTLPMFKPPKILLDERQLRWSVDETPVYSPPDFEDCKPHRHHQTSEPFCGPDSQTDSPDQ